MLISEIVVAIVGILGSFTLFYFTKKSEREDQWRQRKLEQYENLLLAMSELAFNQQEHAESANKEWVIAFNTISLSASQSVIAALIEFNEALIPKPTKMLKNEDQSKLFRNLVIEIRKDIGLSKIDDEETFEVRFLTLPPGKYSKK